MADFVKGPYVCYADVPSTEPEWHLITTENRLRVIANIYIEPGNKVDEATAALLKTAPELYKALFRLKTEAEINGMDKRPGWDAWVSLANEVLAKARGDL